MTTLSLNLNLKDSFRSLFIPEKDHSFALDAWRSLAMFWIISQHCLLAVGADPRRIEAMQTVLKNSSLRPLFHAHFGVDMFFVISGYLIGGIIIREKRKFGTVRIGRFYLRRMLRMMPIYYVVLILLVVAASLGFLPLPYFLTPAWPNFLYINNFVVAAKEFFPPAWSLAVEEQFYLFFPILLCFVSASGRVLTTVFCWLVLAFVGVHFVIASHLGPHVHWFVFRAFDPQTSDRYHDFLYVKPYIRFSSLFLGALAYIANSAGLAQKMFSDGVRSVVTIAVALALIAFVFHFITYDLTVAQNPVFESLYREIFSIGFILLIFASLYAPIVKTVFSQKIYYPLFQLSYGIYLVHAPVLISLFYVASIRNLVNWNDPTLGQLLTFSTIGFTASALVSVPFYIFVERPFINLRSRLT